MYNILKTTVNEACRICFRDNSSYYFYNVGAINRENDEIQYVDTEIVAFIHCIAALLRKAGAKNPSNSKRNLREANRQCRSTIDSSS